MKRTVSNSECFISVCCQHAIMFVPTCNNVWSLVTPSPIVNAQQNCILDHLRRFVFSLKGDDLALFLRFFTGSSSVTGTKIPVTFCGGLSRHLSSHTCSGTLQLPLSYKTFTEFRCEFQNNIILHNSDFESSLTQTPTYLLIV